MAGNPGASSTPGISRMRRPNGITVEKFIR
jgi:hypothetical protein